MLILLEVEFFSALAEKLSMYAWQTTTSRQALENIADDLLYFI